MATTTPNFGWTVPTSTDLVKDGATAIETLGDAIDASLSSLDTGVAGAWISFTPTFTNFTIGNGTLIAAYKQYGKLVVVRGSVTLGSTSSMGTAMVISHPITGRTAINGNTIIGSGAIIDTGTQTYQTLMNYNSTTGIKMFISNVGGTYPTYTNLSATVPMTWTTNDEFMWYYSYEAA
jgi:hypothetical protein